MDIGPGIRPQPFFKPERHICVEPYWEYAKWLVENRHELWNMTALDALEKIDRVDTIFLLDVIEHMRKFDGERIRDLSKTKADQVVVFTPRGFKEQSYLAGEKDAWGMDGAWWQTHRSGWDPADFKGWDITEDGQSFFAIWGAIPT
jgi:hypothetical protein